jgi:ribonuclease P protein component
VETGTCREFRRGIEALSGLGGGYRFPRKEKLKGRNEIREVFSRKNSVFCSGARLFTLRNGLQYNRIAFTFSRKFGKAVERNYSRRLSREVYRQLKNELREGYDLVLLVYPGQNTFSVRVNQLRELFSRAGLFKCGN